MDDLLEDILICRECDGTAWEMVVEDLTETSFSVKTLRCLECGAETIALPLTH